MPNYSNDQLDTKKRKSGVESDSSSWTKKEATINSDIDEIPNQYDDEENLYDEDLFDENDDIDSY